MKFACDRTCPLYEARDPQTGLFLCRFLAVLSGLGPVKVHSHTATIKVEYRDPDALRRIVEALGGQWLGYGDHKLYEDNHEVGHGFTLPAGAFTDPGFRHWNPKAIDDFRNGYPIVMQEGGTFAYDDMLTAPLKQFLEQAKGAYAQAQAKAAAEAQGWLCEQQGENLVIYHPSGGQLTVTRDATLDAAQFIGSGCHEAAAALGLTYTDVQLKTESGQCQQQVQQGH